MGSEVSRSSCVLVTGASSGLGEATVKVLANAGFQVFAGVRSVRDVKRAASHSSSVTPVMLDVRKPVEIRRAFKLVEELAREPGLDGLVLNAGVASAGPLEITSLQEYRNVFEANFFGAVAVIQNFIPLLRKTRGRIVIVGSASAILPPPFLSAYAASKIALRAVAAALRSELAPWGIRTTLLEPGVIRTPIWKKGKTAGDQFIRNAKAISTSALYLERLKTFGSVLFRISKSGMAPEMVSQKIYRILASKTPPHYRRLGMDANLQSFLSLVLPVPVRDYLISKVLFSPRGR